jgi:very-short-patch-repair endonuclease
VNRARLLRKKATQSERILWQHLRNRSFAGYKFRRQHPFDDYVLDFYCPSAKLAVELDGGGHNYHAGQTRDRARSEFLARSGVVVLRFWNHQFRQELDSVLQAIWFTLEERQKNNPSPSSSPFGKGRGEIRVPSVNGAQKSIIALAHFRKNIASCCTNTASISMNVMSGIERGAPMD